MRCYAQPGVEFKVCSFAAQPFSYKKEYFYEFIDIIPSAVPELAHWQHEGYAIIRPIIIEKILPLKKYANFIITTHNILNYSLRFLTSGYHYRLICF